MCKAGGRPQGATVTNARKRAATESALKVSYCAAVPSSSASCPPAYAQVIVLPVLSPQNGCSFIHRRVRMPRQTLMFDERCEMLSTPARWPRMVHDKSLRVCGSSFFCCYPAVLRNVESVFFRPSSFSSFASLPAREAGHVWQEMPMPRKLCPADAPGTGWGCQAKAVGGGAAWGQVGGRTVAGG